MAIKPYCTPNDQNNGDLAILSPIGLSLLETIYTFLLRGSIFNLCYKDQYYKEVYEDIQVNPS